MLIGIVLFVGLVNVVGGAIAGLSALISIIIGAILFLGLFIFKMILNAGLVQVALDVVDKKSVKFSSEC